MAFQPFKNFNRQQMNNVIAAFMVFTVFVVFLMTIPLDNSERGLVDAKARITHLEKRLDNVELDYWDLQDDVFYAQDQITGLQAHVDALQSQADRLRSRVAPVTPQPPVSTTTPSTMYPTTTLYTDGPIVFHVSQMCILLGYDALHHPDPNDEDPRNDDC